MSGLKIKINGEEEIVVKNVNQVGDLQLSPNLQSIVISKEGKINDYRAQKIVVSLLSKFFEAGIDNLQEFEIKEVNLQGTIPELVLKKIPRGFDKNSDGDCTVSKLIAKFLSKNSLEKLKLVKCELGDEGMKIIADELLSGNSSIEVVDFSSNKITNEGLCCLGNTLLLNKASRITEVRLDNNNITGQGKCSWNWLDCFGDSSEAWSAVEFFEKLYFEASKRTSVERTHVKKLSMRDNDISDEDSAKIAQLVEQNKHLTEVDIRNGNQSSKYIAQIEKHCRSHKEADGLRQELGRKVKELKSVSLDLKSDSKEILMQSHAKLIGDAEATLKGFEKSPTNEVTKELLDKMNGLMSEVEGLKANKSDRSEVSHAIKINKSEKLKAAQMQEIESDHRLKEYFDAFVYTFSETLTTSQAILNGKIVIDDKSKAADIAARILSLAPFFLGAVVGEGIKALGNHFKGATYKKHACKFKEIAPNHTTLDAYAEKIARKVTLSDTKKGLLLDDAQAVQVSVQ